LIVAIPGTRRATW